MSLAHAVWLDAHSPLHDARTPLRGRQATEEELRHVFAGLLLESHRFPAANVAALFGVSRRTVYLWRDKALAYDIPEAEGLRRIMAR
jgi:hypothetical protein